MQVDAEFAENGLKLALRLGRPIVLWVLPLYNGVGREVNYSDPGAPGGRTRVKYSDPGAPGRTRVKYLT